MWTCGKRTLATGIMGRLHKRNLILAVISIHGISVVGSKIQTSGTCWIEFDGENWLEFTYMY